LAFRTVLSHLTTGLFTVLIHFGAVGQSIDINERKPGIVLSDSLLNDTTALNTSLPNDTLVQDSVKVVNKKSKNALDSKVIYTAKDSMRFDVKNKKVYLFGEGDVTYGNIHLVAEYIEINWETNTIHSEGRPDSTGKIIGKPKFSEGGQTFDASQMDYNFKTKKGLISDVFTKQGDGYLHGDKVKKNELDEFFVRQGKYTTCNLPDHPHFYINASKIKVIPNSKIISGPANLVIEDVPTPLVVPFGIFPNSTTRKSGIMFPTYGESPGLGFFLMDGGYYFGINDKIDASLRGDIYSRGSWGLKAGTSYNIRYRFNGSFDARYAKILQGDPDLIGSRVNKDFFINWRHNQDPRARPNSRFSASVQAGTSNYNLLNSLNPQSIVANTFQSSISYSKTFGNSPFSIVLGAGHSQNTSTRIVSVSAPDIQLNMNRIFPFKRKNLVGTQRWYEKIGITYTMQARNNLTLADTLIGRPGWLNQMNNGVLHQIPISTSIQVLKYFTFSPGASFQVRNYFNSIERRYDSNLGQTVTDTIRGFHTLPDYNVNASLTTRVYNFLQVGKNTVRHVMTPQLGFRYQPDFSTQEFGFIGPGASLGSFSPYENGIFGPPPVGRQGTFTIGLNNNVEAKVHSRNDSSETGLRKIVLLDVFNVGTGYNIAADSLNWQVVNFSARTKLFKNLDFVYNTNYDLYALQPGTNTRINTFQVNQNGKFLRLVNTNLALTTSLRSKTKNPVKTSNSGTIAERNMLQNNPLDYVDFNIPWSLNISFVVSATPTNDGLLRNDVLNFNGDINLTNKWKIGFNSGYDFRLKKPSFTTIDIFRDLHCWEMSFNWIPVGIRKSYNFTIRVKSSMLQDLRVNRRRQWFDLQNP